MEAVRVLGRTLVPAGFQRNELFLLLALSYPRPLSRGRILQTLFPDVEPDAARNRLRVALTRLRSTNLIRETADGILLDGVTTDLADLRLAWGAVLEEPDAGTELLAMGALIEPLGEPLCPDMSWSWIEGWQQDWVAEASGVLRIIIEIAEGGDVFDTLYAAGRALLQHLPYDERGWRACLKADSRRGTLEKGLRAFHAAKRDLHRQNLGFSLELLEYAESLELETKDALPFGAAQETLLLGYFKRVITERPDLAYPLFAGDPFRNEVLNHPAEALPILRHMMSLNPPAGTERERIQGRIITALALVEDVHELIREAEAFLAEDIALARRRTALLNVSFTYLLVGRIDEARQSIEEAIQIAESEGSMIDVWQYRSQRASFDLLLDEFDTAVPTLEAAVSFLRAQPGYEENRDSLVISSNLALAYIRCNRLEEAARLIQAVETAVARQQLTELESLTSQVRLNLAIALGDEAQIVDQGIRAIRTSYRISRRRTLTSIGWVAEELFRRKHASGRELLMHWNWHFAESGLAYLPPQARQRDLVDNARPTEPLLLLELCRKAISALKSMT